MRFILQLRHWQLFLLVIGGPLLADLFGVTGQGQFGTIDLIIGLVTVSTVFGWIWTIPNGLYKLLPNGLNFGLWGFRIVFIFALTLLISLF